MCAEVTVVRLAVGELHAGLGQFEADQLGEEPTDAFGYLHHLFLKGDVPPEANRVLLDLLGRGLYRPGREVEVRVDHLDTTQLLREYRDTLVMLDTPLAPLTYDENGGLEARK